MTAASAVRPCPQSFQTRLTFAFMGVVALTLVARGAGRHQPPRRLLPPARGAGPAVPRRHDGPDPRRAHARVGARRPGRRPRARGRHAGPPPQGARRSSTAGSCDLTASRIAQADTVVTVGLVGPDTRRLRDRDAGPRPVVRGPAPGRRRPGPGAATRRSRPRTTEYKATDDTPQWGILVTLSNPYTSRASTSPTSRR